MRTGCRSAVWRGKPCVGNEFGFLASRTCGLKPPQLYTRKSCFSTAAISEEFFSTDNRKQHLEQETLSRLGRELGVTQLEDWYSVSWKAVTQKLSELRRESADRIHDTLEDEENSVRSSLAAYPSLPRVLKAVYPQFPWQMSKFKRAPRGYLDSPSKQREKISAIGQALGVKNVNPTTSNPLKDLIRFLKRSDWYTIATGRVVAMGGRALLERYNSSLEQLLMALFPDYPWDPSKFQTRAPPFYWQDTDNLLGAIERAEQKLGITQPEDWYTVTVTDLRAIGFPQHVTKVQLATLLGKKYPDHKWEQLFILRGRYIQQRRLEKAVASLFPGEEIHINARKEAALIDPATNDYLELDIYIPARKLAFEYQEKHHYIQTSWKPLEDIQRKDKTKRELAETKGITLVTVPFWWDGKTSSLVGTIRKARSDLLSDTPEEYTEIPEVIPPEFAMVGADFQSVEGIGRPITACFLTQSAVDPTNWWVFEKYDGVRGFWNPEKKVFYSRFGKPLIFPDEIIAAMPDIYLDGELWFGRESFQEAMKIAHRMDVTAIDWSRFKYMVFDLPKQEGTYEERYAALVDHFKRVPCKYVEVAPREQCRDITHLEKFFQDIIDEGGEGVILRDPSSPYQSGRSPGYLKHKKFRDAEAKIVKRIGPHEWECELPNGVRFRASSGTTEFSNRWNPQKDDIVSFKHHGFLLTSKKPKFPTIYRLRTDLKWDDVVNNWNEHKTIPMARTLSRTKSSARNKGHWTLRQNRRQFFIDYAKKEGFQHLDVKSWKDVNVNLIRAKGGGGIISKYEGNLKKALADTFPELPWDDKIPSTLSTTQIELKSRKSKPRHYWADIANRKEFLENFAVEAGFDPLVADNWQKVTISQILANGGAGLLSMYDDSLKRALIHTFPEARFPYDGEPKRMKWKTAKTCRTFFDEFAKDKGFDPLDPKNWSSINLSDMLAKKGGYNVQYANQGFKRALEGAYPEVQFSWLHPSKSNEANT